MIQCSTNWLLMRSEWPFDILSSDNIDLRLQREGNNFFVVSDRAKEDCQLVVSTFMKQILSFYIVSAVFQLLLLRANQNQKHIIINFLPPHRLDFVYKAMLQEKFKDELLSLNPAAAKQFETAENDLKDLFARFGHDGK